MIKNMPLKLATGATVGRVENGIAIIPATPKNYFARLHGVSVDQAVLNQILGSGAKEIEIQYTSKKKTERLRISVADFMTFKRPTPNFGYGQKWVVHEDRYEKVEAVS